MKPGLGVPILVACLGAALPAGAQELPAACSATRNAQAYQAGVLGGASLVRQAWAAIRDCDRIELLESVVQAGLRRSVPTSSPTPYLQCRFAGMVNGAMAETEGLFYQCADACYMEGQFVGEIAAFAYCELSILLGGLALADDFIRGPVQTCGLGFEIACDTNFVTTAMTYSNASGSCTPYTRNPFVAVFEQTRENQCAYVPIDPEDP
jgi:hypothetical protein